MFESSEQFDELFNLDGTHTHNTQHARAHKYTHHMSHSYTHTYDTRTYTVEDEGAKKDMIGMLHKILRPFMIRRLKADVEGRLPPKVTNPSPNSNPNHKP